VIDVGALARRVPSRVTGAVQLAALVNGSGRRDTVWRVLPVPGLFLRFLCRMRVVSLHRNLLPS
jgi:hypothetical protein